jgi:hypothetical protein
MPSAPSPLLRARVHGLDRKIVLISWLAGSVLAVFVDAHDVIDPAAMAGILLLDLINILSFGRNASRRKPSRVAELQHSLVTAKQATAAGYSTQSQHHKAKVRNWIHEDREIYRFARYPAIRNGNGRT